MRRNIALHPQQGLGQLEMGLPGWISDPWPPGPWAVSRSQVIPFSAICTKYARRPSAISWLNPPASPIDSVQPSNRSGWVSTSHPAPSRPPFSSSASSAITMSRAGRHPLASLTRSAVRVIAIMSFMSTAPRPQT